MDNESPAQSNLVGAHMMAEQSQQHPDREQQVFDPIQGVLGLEKALLTEPIIWLASDCPMQDLLAQIEVQIRAGHNDYVCAGTPSAERSTLAPLRPLLHCLLVLAGNEATDLMRECASELSTLLPDDIALEGVPPLETLVQMSLNAARMLPLESEYLFRIVMRIGWFIESIGRRNAVLHGRKFVLVFPYLDELDRPTLLTIYHLCWRARAGAFSLILVSPSLPGNGSSLQRQSLFDRDYERRVLLARLYERVQPALLKLQAWNSESSMPISSTFAPGSDAEATTYRQALAVLHTDAGEEAKAVLMRAVMVSTQHLNVEMVLALIEEALTNRAVDGDREFSVSNWQIAGAAHASIGNYVQAIECFERGLALTESPLMRAKLCMYLALVLAKRLARFEEAEDILAQGYTAIETLETPDSWLERGWLHNLKALMAYRRRDYAQALRLTQSAIEFMKPHSNGDAIALKTNLVANASMVFESIGKYERALHMWSYFRTFVEEAGDIFGKYYYYREAGLQVKAGLVEASIQGYHYAFEQAQRVGDLVTMEAAARAQSRLAYQSSRYEVARSWAERVPSLLAQIGNYRLQHRSWMFLAACHARLANSSGVELAIEEALRSLYQRDQSAEQASIEATSECIRENISDSSVWEQWLPEWPSTLLRWPTQLFLP